MSLKWTGRDGSTPGSYEWNSGEICSGWTAMVRVAHAGAPKAQYIASASCRWWLLDHHETFKNLDDAKCGALNLVLKQNPASPDQSCMVAPDNKTITVNRAPVIK